MQTFGIADNGKVRDMTEAEIAEASAKDEGGEGITDTDRINAIAEGFLLVQELLSSPYGWVEIWKCYYGIDKIACGLSFRSAIDEAIIAERNLNEEVRSK